METTFTPPCFAMFRTDGSPMRINQIVNGITSVGNECGDVWDEPAANLRPADEGWSW